MLHKPMRSEKSVLRYPSSFIVGSSPRTREERKAKQCLFQRSLRASNHSTDEVFDLAPNYLTVCALLLPEEPVKWNFDEGVLGCGLTPGVGVICCPQCLHDDGMNRVSLYLWYRELKGTGLNMEVWAICFSKHR